MPLDLDGFVTPEQDFKGLNNVASQLYRQKTLQSQAAQRQMASKNAAAKYLSTYLNKNDHFTGTQYDPEITGLLDEAMRTGSDLASKGSDIGTINMVIAPLINRLNTYESQAKQVSARSKMILDEYSKVPGANIPKMQELINQYTFPTDPKTGKIDYDNIDPTLQTAMKKITENNLSDIYNEGDVVKNWAGQNQPSTYNGKITTEDKRGKRELAYKVSAPDWQVFDPTGQKDQFGRPQYAPVPKYDHAYDHDKNMPITHPFKNSDGSTTDLPIRLLDEGTFNSYMQSGDSRAAIINGKLRQTLKEYKDVNGHDIDPSSPEAKLVARAIAYDTLKPYAKGTFGYEDNQTISGAQRREDFGFSPYAIPKWQAQPEGGSGSGVQINDVVGKLKDRMKNVPIGSHQQINTLDSDESDLVFDALTKRGHTGLTEADIQLQNDANGRMYVAWSNKHKKTEGQPIVYLSGSANTKVQPTAKMKAESVRRNNAEAKTPTSNKVSIKGL